MKMKKNDKKAEEILRKIADSYLTFITYYTEKDEGIILERAMIINGNEQTEMHYLLTYCRDAISTFIGVMKQSYDQDEEKYEEQLRALIEDMIITPTISNVVQRKDKNNDASLD
jgi:hypothetical protein